MQEKVSDQYSVAAVMLKQKSKHPWGENIWSLAGVIPGVSPTELSQLEAQGEVYLWPDLSLSLHPLHGDSYYHNLMSGKPKIYLICNQPDEDVTTLKPLLITVDPDEAASYMETDEQVLSASLSVELSQWLERFVLTHYQPEEPKKRRRKQWHNDEQKNDSKARQ
tara:strand:+ start:432793 stop:433287 length:495 start_codon:yes stop_codon:yes gene_type:complete